MLYYLRLFIDLCLFRQQAANVPRSESLLVITATAAILSAAINAIPDEGFGRGVLL